MSKTSTIAFTDILENAISIANERIKARESAEQALRKARELEADQRRTVTRLNKLLYLSRWTVNPLEWHEREGGGGCRKIVRLETPDYHFELFLNDTGLKRTPYEVDARLWKTELSTNPRDIHGGYRMNDYGRKKYGDAVETRFKTLALAEQAIEMWKKELYEAHKAEIDHCRDLRKRIIEEGATFKENDNLIGWDDGRRI